MKNIPYKIEEEIIKVPRFEEGAGFYTTKQRSRNMSRIRSKNSVPELILRKALWSRSVRYRIHKKGLPGSPDLVINKYRLAIFIDGDFWHGYKWEQKRDTIKSNTKFWIPKIERNMQKDRLNNARLSQMGYTVMRFWEHEVKNNLERCINQILLYIEAAKEDNIPITE